MYTIEIESVVNGSEVDPHIELSQIADDLTIEIEIEIESEEEFNIGTLTVFSKSQGQWLYANHDSFKPLTTELI